MAELVVEGFPDGVSQEKVPVIGFYIDVAGKRRSDFTVGVLDLGMVDTELQLLVFSTFDVHNETEFDINDGWNVSRVFDGGRQFLRIGIPLRVGAKGSNSKAGRRFSHRYF